MTLCLAASANAREAPQPLVQVWVTPKSLKEVEACVIKALDTDQHTFSRISPSVRHVAKVRVPDSIVEIRPVKDHAVADMNHYVRLEKIAEASRASSENIAVKVVSFARCRCGRFTATRPPRSPGPRARYTVAMPPDASSTRSS